MESLLSSGLQSGAAFSSIQTAGLMGRFESKNHPVGASATTVIPTYLMPSMIPGRAVEP